MSPIKNFDKKIKLANAGKRTRWAPVWVILKKFGVGKKVHPSRLTRQRRSWRRTKLKISPRKLRRSHYG